MWDKKPTGHKPAGTVQNDSCSHLLEQSVRTVPADFFQNVYVDEIHLFFRDDRLVQAGYYFRTDPNNVGQMSEALDAQYGPHTLSVSKQITDVDLYTWEKDGRIITLEEIQIEAFLVGYYTHVVIVYSNQ